MAGSLTASYLDYDSNGHAGISTTTTAAQLSIEDSTLHGSGPTADFLVSSGGATKFHIAYTTISNVHCGFHFDSVSEFDVSYSNIEGNAFGFMLYGSGGAGPFSVTYSNLYSNSSYDYDTEGTNSPITFDHDYTADATNPGDAVTTTNAQTAKVCAGRGRGKAQELAELRPLLTAGLAASAARRLPLLLLLISLCPRSARATGPDGGGGREADGRRGNRERRRWETLGPKHHEA